MEKYGKTWKLQIMKYGGIWWKFRLHNMVAKDGISL